ncbi:MAG: class I SAM-dependent methyltransferase [Bdellovibrio sp.]|nr:class I SAM-dependent methyltransferase [Methylotenera sp.]
MNLVNEKTVIDNQPQLTELLAYLKINNYRFITISPASHEIVNSRLQNSVANNLIEIFGWNRLFKREDIDAALFDLMQLANIAVKVGDYWKSQLRVSSIDALLFLHSAYPTLGNEAVFFGPDTYRFANVVQQYLASKDFISRDFISNLPPTYRAVDIGTGSGVGAVLLALALTELKIESEIVASDINSEALSLARANINAAAIHNIELIQSNLLNTVAGSFDLIVANPPYLLDKTERAYRHGGGQLGADLSLAIVDAAIERLNPNGTLLLYTGVAIVNGHDAFLAAAAAKLNIAGFTYQYVEIDPDIFGEELNSEAYHMADRIAAVVLTARRQAT